MLWGLGCRVWVEVAGFKVWGLGCRSLRLRLDTAPRPLSPPNSGIVKNQCFGFRNLAGFKAKF